MPFANSADAIAVTVPALKPTGLGVRLASALILIPVALLTAVFGTPYFDALVVVFGALMAWEWGRLVGSGQLLPAGIVGIVAVVAAILAIHLVPTWQAAALLAAGAVLAAAVAGVARGMAGWFALGVLYVGLPCIAILWLRSAPLGLATLLWIFALVWATDTGAYFAGRAIGGPKLMPSVSPKKTWAGLVGGMAAAALAGIGAGVLVDGAAPWLLAAVSAVLAVIAQTGDLGESALKRRFGAKDSSGLIPGHGGVLDRVDGLITVILAVAVAAAVSGESVVAWR